MKIFKYMLKIIVNILKTVFCLFVTGDIFYTKFILDIQGEQTLQMKVYWFLLIVLAILCWGILFSKFNRIIKTSVIIAVILFNCSAKIVPDVKYAFDFETCFDIGVCREGLEIKTRHGLMKVNKENCLKYNYVWNDKKKYCEMPH